MRNKRIIMYHKFMSSSLINWNLRISFACSLLSCRLFVENSAPDFRQVQNNEAVARWIKFYREFNVVHFSVAKFRTHPTQIDESSVFFWPNNSGWSFSHGNVKSHSLVQIIWLIYYSTVWIWSCPKHIHISLNTIFLK